MNNVLFNTPTFSGNNPEVITVERQMYLVPKDATIPGGMVYRHTGGYCAFDTEYVTASGGLTPDDRAAVLDFYTYEKVDSPEPKLTVQGGLVLGNVRYAVEDPKEARPVVTFLDEDTAVVIWPDGSVEYEDSDDFNPNRHNMIFDVIFDPEHDNAARVAG